jgi:hypothetical protein
LQVEGLKGLKRVGKGNFSSSNIKKVCFGPNSRSIV